MPTSSNQYDIIINLITSGAGSAEIIAALQAIQDKAQQTQAAIQNAAATQPGLINNQGQYTGAFSQANTQANPTATTTFSNAQASAQMAMPGFDNASIRAQSDAMRDATHSANTFTEAERAQTEAAANAYVANQQSAQEINQLANAYSNGSEEIVTATQAQVNATEAVVKARQRDVSEIRSQIMEYRFLQRAGGMLTQIGTTFFVPSVAVLTAASLMANNYVKGVTTATAITTSWRAATESVALSQSKIGETLAVVELPALQEAAKVMNVISAFVAANPDAVRIGLETVAVVAGISGLLMLIGKGITLYADVKYIGAVFALFDAEKALTLAEAENTAAVMANTDAMLLSKGLGIAGETAAFGAVPAGRMASALAGGTAVAEVAAPVAEATVAVGGFAAGLATVTAAAASFVLPVAALAAELAYAKAKNIDLWLSFRQGATIAAAGVGTFLMAGETLVESLVKGKPVVELVSKHFNDIFYVLGKILGLPINESNGPLPVTPYQDTKAYLSGETAFASHMDKLATIQKTYDTGMEDEATSYYQSVAKLNLDYQKKQTQEYAAQDNALLEAQQQYDEQVKSQSADFLQSQMQALADYNQQVADSANSFNDQQALSARNFAEQQTQSEFDYQQSKADAIAAYNDAGLQAEKDYQKSLVSQTDDFLDKEMEMTAAGDALGLAKAKEAADEQKKTITDNYNDSETKRKADFDKQQALAERNYQEQRQKAIDSYNQQQNDALVAYNKQAALAQRNYDESAARAMAAFVKQQADEKTQFDEAQAKRVANFADQQALEAVQHADELTALNNAHEDKIATLILNYASENALETKLFQTTFDNLRGIITAEQIAMWNDYVKFMAALGVHITATNPYAVNMPVGTNPGSPTSPPIPITGSNTNGSTSGGLPITTRDYGGYAMPGLFRNASSQAEFVLSPGLTRFAEQAVGAGSLTQSSIRDMMSKNGGYNDNRRIVFEGTIRESDRIAIRQDIRTITEQVLKEQFG